MEEIEKPTILATRGGLWLRLKGAEIHLGVEQDFKPAQKTHPGLICSDLDALAVRLSEAAKEVTWDDAVPGRRRFFTTDPVGNRLEFLEPAELVAR